jgi:hypothetical protein
MAMKRWAVVLTDFVDRADIGVIERSRSTRLTEESFEGLLITGNFIRKEFQSDSPAERRVLGLVHNTHPAATEFSMIR